MTERREPPWDERVDDLDTEQLLTDWFNEEAPTREPAVLAPSVIARTALTRRRSRWVIGDWWRDLFRSDQRPSLKPALGAVALAVVAVFMLAVVSVGLLGLIKTAPVMPDYVPADALLVSDDDADSHATIAGAIAAAADGDTVAILPGTYSENLVVDKAITLLGAGERDSIVLQPADPEQPIIAIDGADATLTGFTITGPGSSVNIIASAPLIENMTFREVGDRWWTYTGAGWDGFDDASPSILVDLFAEATIRNSRFDGGGEIEVRGGSDAQILDNVLVNGAVIFLNDAGSATVVRGNTITDAGLYSIESTSSSELLIEGNTITQSDPGIGIQAVRLQGTIRDNIIRGGNIGIQLADGATPVVTGNVIDTDGAALEINSDVDPVITGNELCGGNSILAVFRDAVAPDVSDNTLCDAPLIFE